MNKKTLIGIGIGAIAVGIFLLAVTNPNLRENKDTYFGFIDTSFEQGEELRMPSGEKVCCEKYQVIHEVLSETVLMSEDNTYRYIIKEYSENPEYNEECSRLWVQMTRTPLKQKYEPLTDDEYRELQSVFQLACNNAIFTKPPPFSP